MTATLLVQVIFALMIYINSAWSDEPENKVTVIPKPSMQELCEFDLRCKYGFDPTTGIAYPIEPEVAFRLSNHHEEFKKWAERYDVDPRAAAGAIAAENTMNVQVDDDVTDFMAQNVSSRVSTIVSTGLGQMKTPAAMIAERKIAELENRRPRPESQIRDLVNTETGSIQLITGYMRYAQDEYEKRGVDISDRPDILTTLYNVGKVERRAAALTPDSVPKANYFGGYVAHKMKEIEELIGWSPVEGASVPDIAKRIRYDLHHIGRKKQSLYSRPPTCTDGETNILQAQLARDQTFNGYREVGEINGIFQIISTDISCDMERWVLVQTDDVTGWAKYTELASKMRDYDMSDVAAADKARVLKQKEAVCSAGSQICMERVAAVTGTETELTETPGRFLVQLNAFTDQKPSFKHFRSSCLKNAILTSNLNSVVVDDQPIPITGLNFPEIKQKVEAKIAEIKDIYGVQDADQLPDGIGEPLSYLEMDLRKVESFLNQENANTDASGLHTPGSQDSYGHSHQKMSRTKVNRSGPGRSSLISQIAQVNKKLKSHMKSHSLGSPSQRIAPIGVGIEPLVMAGNPNPYGLMTTGDTINRGYIRKPKLDYFLNIDLTGLRRVASGYSSNSAQGDDQSFVPTFAKPTPDFQLRQDRRSTVSRLSVTREHSQLEDALWRSGGSIMVDSLFNPRFRGSASASNILDTTQPVGPASAPRGRTATQFYRDVSDNIYFRKRIKFVSESCGKFFNGDPGLARRFQTLRTQETPNDRALVGDSLYALPKLCDNYQKLASVENHDDLDEIDMCDSYEKTCEVSYLDQDGIRREDAFPYDHILKHKDLLAIDELLPVILSQYFKSSLEMLDLGHDRDGCSYDPMGTNRKIEVLSALPCVASVLVPEGPLFNHHERNGTNKVAYTPNTGSDSSYSVVAANCSIGKSYEEETAEEQEKIGSQAR